MSIQLHKHLGTLLYYCLAYMVTFIILAFVVFIVRACYDYGKVVIECRYPMMTACSVPIAIMGVIFVDSLWEDWQNGELANTLF
jgi:hypothetical protein